MSEETERKPSAATGIEELREIVADLVREGERAQQEAEKRRAEFEEQRAEFKEQRTEFEKQRAEFKKWRTEFGKWRAKYKAEREWTEAEAKRRNAELEAERKRSEAEKKKRSAELDEERAEDEERMRRMEAEFYPPEEKLAEALRKRELAALFQKRGIVITGTGGGCRWEFRGRPYGFEAMANNASDMIAVQVRHSLWVQHVKEFLETLQIYRRASSAFVYKRFFGAVAYLEATKKSIAYAQEHGLFVIRGIDNGPGKKSTARIVNPEDFEARQF